MSHISHSLGIKISNHESLKQMEEPLSRFVSQSFEALGIHYLSNDTSISGSGFLSLHAVTQCVYAVY